MSTEENAATKEDMMCTVEETGIWCPKIFGALLEDPSTHDVTFKTSDGGSVSAHRVIVAAGSRVFHAMLYGNMKESSQKEIELPNIEEDILRHLLTFMYTGKVCFSMDRCVDILDAAHYFGVEILESCCADYIETTLAIENCCENVTVAHKKNIQVLVAKCLSFMFNHAVELIKLPQFKELPVDVLLAFLESSDVCAEEIEIFLAAVDWYKHQGSQNSEVTNKGIFQLVRYPLISKSDLIHKVRPVEEIDSVLYTAALEYHLLPEEYAGPPEQIKPRCPFFEVISVTPSTVTLEKNKDKTVISRIGSRSWRELCVIKVTPFQQNPLKFTLCLEAYCDRSYIVFSLKSVKFESIPRDRNDVNGFNAMHLKQGEATDVTVSYSGPSKVVVNIGLQSQSVTVRDTSVFLCIYFYNPGDKLVISCV
ncbi:kelch-like protein 26 [Dysidea avara]|uniref:kelch-like protein 26 n=1 Tax=Dysidea avara TaxID=196820 RepID=UPI00331877A7